MLPESSKLNFSFQITLFEIIKILLDIIIPTVDDKFCLIQTTKADMNTRNFIWTENFKEKSDEWIEQIIDILVEKYQIVQIMVNSI